MSQPANHMTPQQPLPPFEAQEFRVSGILQDAIVAGVGAAAMLGIHTVEAPVLTQVVLDIVPAALVLYGLGEMVGRIRNRPSRQQR